jgi:DNA-binding LacI/PurR family transcriptional regulator
MVIDTADDFFLAASERFDIVSVDDRQGSYLAGQYLRKCGWENVCFIGRCEKSTPTVFDRTSRRRLYGLIDGLERKIPSEYQLPCESYTSMAGAKIVSKWVQLSPRPAVISAASDDIALGFVHGAVAYGLTAGKDYHIIGFDGQQTGPDDEIGTLTTIAAPMAEMGSMAAEMLIQRLNKPELTPRRIYLGCSLVEGNTVGQNSKALP